MINKSDLKFASRIFTRKDLVKLLNDKLEVTDEKWSGIKKPDLVKLVYYVKGAREDVLGLTTTNH